MTKSEIRNILREFRETMSESVYLEHSERIQLRLIEWIGNNADKKILVYISSEQKREVATDMIISHLFNAGFQVAVPKVTGADAQMECVQIDINTKYIPNKWGIFEPDADTYLPGDWADICVVPMMGGDLDGGRIGYGKGYYDAFLSGKHLKKIGLCFADCILPEVPSEKHDIRLDYIITEDYFRRIGKRI